MTLKKAYRLSPTTLNPKSIEKTSVKLAVSVFSESTCDALQFYSANEGQSSWAAIATFISLMLKLWNILNVKTGSKDKHKRDYTMDPVRSSMDWKLAVLQEFSLLSPMGRIKEIWTEQKDVPGIAPHVSRLGRLCNFLTGPAWFSVCIARAHAVRRDRVSTRLAATVSRG